jgi:hypothetical protein
MSELALYHFAGAPEFENEMRSRFTADQDDVATVGDAVLTVGKIDNLKLSVLIESAGETALLVEQEYVDAIQPGWED